MATRPKLDAILTVAVPRELAERIETDAAAECSTTAAWVRDAIFAKVRERGWPMPRVTNGAARPNEGVSTNG